MCVNVRGQWQLHQNAMNGRVLVEGVNALQQLRFRQGSRVVFQHRVQSGIGAGLDLVAHVHLRGRVFADQQHGQAGSEAAGFQRSTALADAGTGAGGKGIAVDESCAVDSVHGGRENEKRPRLSSGGRAGEM